MNLEFDKKIADNYSSNSQKIRVLTEDWVKRNLYLILLNGLDGFINIEAIPEAGKIYIFKNNIIIQNN